MTLPSTPSSPMNTEVGFAMAQERLACPLCELNLSNGEDLQQHVLTHDREQQSFTCKVCSKTFPDVANFGRHVRLHTGEKPFKCEQCGKRFGEKCTLTRHARTHTGEKPFECPLCGKCFSDVGSFGRHKKTHMGEKAKVHHCEFDGCTSAFYDRSSLRRHEKKHTGEKPFQCKICNRRFTESGSYKRHQRIHTGEKRYKCRTCGRPFSERASMVRHERNSCKLSPVSNPDHDTANPAVEEDKGSLSSLDDLVRSHIGESSDALNNNNILCSYFNHDSSRDVMEYEASTNDKSLDSNFAKGSQDIDGGPAVDSAHKGSDETAMDRVTTKPIQRLPSVCEDDSRGSQRKSSNTPSFIHYYGQTSPREQATRDSPTNRICSVPPKMLQWHHHQEAKPFTSIKMVRDEDRQMCFECGDVLNEDDDEERNASDTASTSSDGKRAALRCKACRQESLPSHSNPSPPSVMEESRPLQSKPGRRVHACSVCGKTFRDSSKLKRHMKIHLGVRDFKCETCGKCFLDACGLRRHSSLHSDVKPHNCIRCGKGFTDSSGLKKHLVRCSTRYAMLCKGTEVTEVKKVDEALDFSVKGRSVDGALDLSTVKSGTVKSKEADDAETVKVVEQHKGNGVKGDKNELFNCVTARSNGGLHQMEPVLKPEETLPNLVEALHANTDKENHTKTNAAQNPTQNCLVRNPRQNHVAINLSQNCVDTSPTQTPTDTSPTHEDSNIRGSPSQTTQPHVSKQHGKSFQDERSLRSHFAEHVVDGTNSDLQGAVTCQLCGKMFRSLHFLQKHIIKNHGGFVFGTGGPERMSPPVAFSKGKLKDEKENNGNSLTTQSATPVFPTPAPLLPSPTAWFPSKDITLIDSVFPTFPSSSTSHRTDQSLPSDGTPPQLSPAGEGSPKCEVCGKTFDDLSSLKRHTRLHTEQPLQLPCRNCDKVFNDQGSLKRHSLRGCKSVVTMANQKAVLGRKSVAGETVSEDQFACTQCQMVFATREEQMTHEKEHRVAPELCCAVCRKSFSTAAELHSHQLLHEAERPFSCDVCLKGFAESGARSKHRARGCFAHCSVVLDSSKLRCSQCGKVFSDQLNFDQHVSTHRGVKPYVCNLCGKSFTEACSLKRHTRQHTGQNLCRCLQCGRTFLENSGLKKHLQRRSCLQEKKPVKSWLYPCSTCKKVFTKRYILFRHMKTHMGLRPFACDKCNKSFTESSSLKRHYRQHTGERPYRCEGCHKTFTDAGVLKKHKQRCPYVADDDDYSASLLDCGPAPYLQNGSAFVTNTTTPLDTMTSEPVPNGHDTLNDKGHSSKVINGSKVIEPITTEQTNDSNKKPLTAQRWLQTTECWRCGRCFPTAEQRQQHSETAHRGLRSFGCRQCWRRFSRLAYLRVHRMRCHSVQK